MKKNKSIMIASSILIAVITIMLVYVILISTGVVVAKKYTIRIEAVDASKEYDGTPLTLSEYRVIDGQEILDKRHHELVVNFVGNQIDAGTSQGELIASVFDSSGADVTKKYNFEVAGGSITVTPRLIKMKTTTITKEYDGTPLTVEDASFQRLSGDAVVGQTIVYKLSGEMTEIGETYIDVIMEITDSNNQPISPLNYQVIYEDEDDHGKVVVTPRYITVMTQNMHHSYTYDGRAHGADINSYDWDKQDAYNTLLPGHQIRSLNLATSEVDAGEYVLDDFNFVVVDSRGVDVSKYYAADPASNFETMTISPVEITLKTYDVIKAYDGTPLSFEPRAGVQYDVWNWIQAPSTDSYEIVFLHTLTDADEVENEAEIFIHNDKNEDVTKNYKVTYDFGIMRVTQREITLKTFSDSRFFTGEPLIGRNVTDEAGNNYEITAGSLAPNQKIKVELNAKQVDGGSTANTINKVYILDSNNDDVTENYVISKDEGTLEIKKVVITIKTASGEWLYDGNEHCADSYDISGAEGVSIDQLGFRVVFNNWPKATDATFNPDTGEVVPVTNKPNIIIYDKNSNVVYNREKGLTDNFEAYEEYGTIAVKPIEVSFTTESNAKTYDGTPCYNHTRSGFVVANGHRLSDLIWPDVTDVQRDKNGNVISVENKPQFVIYDNNGRDITKNYYIKGNYGSLTVSPRQLSVSTNSKQKVYDGLEFGPTDLEYNIATDSLAAGDYIGNVVFTNAIGYTDVIRKGTSVESKDNTIDFEVFNSQGIIVTSNYEIRETSIGKLTISPVIITVSTPSGSFPYDGLAHMVDCPKEEVLEIPENLRDLIDFKVSDFKAFSEVNVDGHVNSCTVKFFKTGNESISMDHNVSIEKNYGKVAIGKVQIHVSTLSATREYNGEELVGQVVVSEESRALLEQLGVTYEIVGTSITDVKRENNKTNGAVKSVDNNIDKTKTVFRSNGVDVTKNFEIIVDEKGELKITPIAITLQTEETKDLFGKLLSATYNGQVLSAKTLVYSDEDDLNLRRYGAQVVVEWNEIKDVQKDKNGDVIKVPTYESIKIVNSSNEDITINFEINADMGYLQINPIEVNGYCAETKEQPNNILEHTWDGQNVVANFALSDDDITKLTNAGIGYTNPDPFLCKDIKGDKASPKSYEIDFSVLFTDSTSGTDVSKNVHVNKNYGYIKIVPVKITVTTNTKAKEYDGTPLFDKGYLLSNGDKAKLDSINANLVVDEENYASITDDGIIDNKLNFSIVDKTTGANYDDYVLIDQKYGKLTVSKLKITVKTAENDTFIYDGSAHEDNTATVIGFETLESLGYSYEITNVQADHVPFINVGEYTNKLSYDFVLKDNLGNVVDSKNYDIVPKEGIIKIKEAEVYIRIDSKTKTFDNTPLTFDDNDWSFFYGSEAKLGGLTLEVTPTSSQTKVGECKLEFAYRVLDNESNDVSGNWTIKNIVSNAKLTVEPFKVTATSGSASKVYDGIALTNGDLPLLTEPVLPDGFTWEATFPNSQTEVGYIENEFNLTIYDSSHNDASITYNGCFDLDGLKFGKLEVLPYVTGTGKLTSQTAEANEDITSLRVLSDSAGTFYLRDRSYGDYIGTGFDYGSIYEYDNSSYSINGTMVASKTIEELGIIPIGTMTITIEEALPYLIPYYSTYLYETASYLDDTHISKSHGAPYEVTFYKYKYNLNDLELTDANYVAFEDDYREFVYNTYLTIDSKLKDKLLAASSEIEQEHLIYKIAEFVHNQYSYGENAGRMNSENMIDSFLSAKRGTCQDFAAFATMLYRAYDIPARFVTGFIVNIDPEQVDTTVEVKQNSAHAWVEVYVDGMGWIPIEVTNGIAMNITDGGAPSDDLRGSNVGGGLTQTGEKPNGDTLLRVQTNQSGVIYLRGESFGDYNGKGFDEVAEVNRYDGASTNPLTYLSNIYDNYRQSRIKIDMTKGGYSTYLTPYFLKGDYASEDDVYIDGNYGSIYTLYYTYNPLFIAANNVKLSTYAKATGALASEEEDYYNYVVSMYTYIGGEYSTLISYLDSIIATEAFNAHDDDIIGKVAEYIQNAATYTYLDYEYADECTDYVYYFLHDLKKGVCEHYAAAATLLFRRLGIPARYTVGVKYTASKDKLNTWVEVTDDSAHAWVEVYLRGLGWVPVEVTGFKDSPDGDGDTGGSGSGNGANKEADAIAITLRPTTSDVKYGEVMDPIEIYLPVKYQSRYSIEGEIDISGISTELGWHTTHITEYTIIDKLDGHDATGEFNVVVEDNYFQVYYDEITISTRSAEKEYDGLPLVCAEIETIDSSKLKPGHSFHEENLVFTNPGQVEIKTNINNDNSVDYSNAIIDDETGLSVTDQYRISTHFGSLNVTKRTLELTAASGYDYGDYEYDPIEDKYVLHEYEITDGSLLPNHHIDTIVFTDDSYLSEDEGIYGADNSIESIIIVDEFDNDVTSYYDYSFEMGELNL